MELKKIPKVERNRVGQAVNDFVKFHFKSSFTNVFLNQKETSFQWCRQTDQKSLVSTINFQIRPIGEISRINTTTNLQLSYFELD